jgi:SAM-dependent methyltransferase
LVVKRTYCTYFDRNYLLRALALIGSLRRHEEQGFEILCVCFDEISRVLLEKLAIPGVTAIPIHDIEAGDEALLACKKERSAVEYYWTSTPTVILRLLERDPDLEALTYLDADLFFFSPPEPIFRELDGRSVLIHEHRFAPRLAYLEQRSGKYNVGLLVFRNDAQGREVLRDWREQCLEWCYSRSEDGKMGDQMYLDDWPERFPAVGVLQHGGAAIAPWNHERYRMEIDASGTPRVGDAPLIFYHFHSLAMPAPDVIVPSPHEAYAFSKEILELVYLPYARALGTGLASLRRELPEFSFGLGGDETANVVLWREGAASIEPIGADGLGAERLDAEWRCAWSRSARSSTPPRDERRTSALPEAISELERELSRLPNALAEICRTGATSPQAEERGLRRIRKLVSALGEVRADRARVEHNPNTVEYYDLLYSGKYSTGGELIDHCYENDERRRWYERVVALRFFDAPGRYLDVGCGIGGMFAALGRREDRELYGIDFSKVAVRQIVSRVPGRFSIGRIEALPYPDRYFQRVICTETLEHADDPSAVLAEMARTLDGGGRLLITVPEASLDLRDDEWPGGVSMHINKFTIDSLAAEVRNVELVVESAHLDEREIWLIAAKNPVCPRNPQQL